MFEPLGLYSSSERFKLLRDVFISYGFENNELFCSYEYDFSVLVGSYFNDCASFYEDGCEIICGVNYRKHRIACCEKCYSPITNNIPAMMRYINSKPSPTYEFYRLLEIDFNWVFIYRPESIYIVVDNIADIERVFCRIPIPLGEELIVLTNC